MPNIAVIVLDTLRKDAFDRHFEWLPGRRFENAWSTSHWTAPVHAGLFGGRYGSEVGVTARTPHLPASVPVLPEALAEAGYTTRAFSCNPFVSSVFGFDRGFEAFDGSWRLRQLDPDLFDWGRFIADTGDRGPSRYLRALVDVLRADVATLPSLWYGLQLKLRELDLGLADVPDDGARAALSFLESTTFGDREFLFVNLMETHAPYDPPDPYRANDTTDLPGLDATVGVTSISDAKRDAARAAYDGSAAYLADMYAEMFEVLRTEFDHVVTLADHGELFGEHGAWKHLHGIYPELVHVPLTLSGPDHADTRTDRPVSLLDVHATIAELADIETDSRGRSLLESAGEDPPPRLAEYRGLREQQLTTLQDRGVDRETVDRYDRPLRGLLAPDGTYSYETPDGFEASRPGRADELRAELDRLDDTLERPEPSGEEPDVADRVYRQLEDLGYA